MFAPPHSALPPCRPLAAHANDTCSAAEHFWKEVGHVRSVTERCLRSQMCALQHSTLRPGLQLAVQQTAHRLLAMCGESHANAWAHALLPTAEQEGHQDPRPHRRHQRIRIPAHAGQEVNCIMRRHHARHGGAGGCTSIKSLSQAPGPTLLSTLITMGFGGTHCTRLQQCAQH
jgi:hypothetical protein